MGKYNSISDEMHGNHPDLFNLEQAKKDVATNDPVHMYLKEIGTVALLSPEEEYNLGLQVKQGREAEFRLLVEKEDLSEQQQQELKNTIKIDEQAKKHLVEANLRLVVPIARRYVGCGGMPLLDLCQEGNLGLMKAAEKFEADRGWRFSTYATWWIRHMIGRAIADQGRNIRISVHMMETINQVVQVFRHLTTKLNREPCPDEIAREMNLPVVKVLDALEAMQETISLETPIGEKGDSVLGDFVFDENAESKGSPESSMFNSELREQLIAVLRTLSPREEKVLWLRFGLEDNQTHTLEEIGIEFNLTKERIRQIEADALRKLNLPSRAKKLEVFWKS